MPHLTCLAIAITLDGEGNSTKMSNNVINLGKDEGYFEYGDRLETAPDSLDELLQVHVEAINLPVGAEDLDEGDLTAMDFKDNGDAAESYRK